MASATVIKECIKMIVTEYSLWEIGITDEPEQSEAEFGNQMGWRLFEADTEEAAKRVEVYFVGKGMQGDSDEIVIGARYVCMFMGLEAALEGDKSFDGLSTTKTMTRYDRYLADFKTMYGDRPDYDFLEGVYAEVITERGPHCTSGSELLAILYGRLESLGIEAAHLAYKGTNKTPSLLPTLR